MQKSIYARFFTGLILAALVLVGTAAWADNYLIAIGINRYPLSTNYVQELTGAAADAVALAQAGIDTGFLPRIAVEGMATDLRAAAARPGEATKRMDAILRKHHYIVLSDGTELKPTRSNILAALSVLAGVSKQNDKSIIYYAGHGVELNGESYLLPSDTRIAGKETLASDLEQTAIRVKVFTQSVEKVAAELMFVSYDMCRNDPRRAASSEVEKQMKAGLGNTLVRDATLRRLQAKNVFTLFSCSRGQTSSESVEKRRGIFSYWFEKGFRGEAADNEGVVSIGSLKRFIRTKVKETVKDQVPLSRKGDDTDDDVEDITLVTFPKTRSIVLEQTPDAIQRGEQMIAARDFEQAKPLFEGLRKSNPKSGRVVYNLARIAYETACRAETPSKQYAEAKQLCEEATRLDAKDAAPLVLLGDISHDTKYDYDEAYKYYRQAFARNQNSPEALNAQGVMLADDGNWAEAAQWHRKALTRNPNFVMAMVNLEMCLIYQGRIAEAEKLLPKAHEAQPKSLCPLLMEAVLAHAKKKYDAMLDWCLRALAIEDHDVDVLLLTALSYMEQNKNSKAEDVAREVLQMVPNNSSAMVILSNIELVAHNNLDKARQLAEQALQHNAKCHGAEFNLGFISYTKQDFVKAKTYLAKAAQFYTRNGTIQKMLGDVNWDSKDFGAAITAYKRSLSFLEDEGTAAEPKYVAEAEAGLGVTYLAMSRMGKGNGTSLKEAEKYLLEALKKDPENGEYHFCYSQILNDQQRFSEAYEERRKSQQLGYNPKQKANP